MNDDDLGSGGVAPSVAQRRPLTANSTSDDLSSGPASPGVGTRPAPTTGEFTAVEVAGDPPRTAANEAAPEGEASSASESGAEVIEATPEQLAATESGEGSAVSDLRGIEGFVESTGSESAGTESGLLEVGQAASGETAEFLPFLAALVPTLISTVGPMIAKGIAGALSPRATKVINRLPVPAAGAGRLPPGSLGALLAQIAQLLNTLKGKVGSESAMEATDEAVVNEAVAVLEVILGTDDRVRIEATSNMPWRRICALRITFPSGARYRGTGFLIGPRALATAGHCVYLHNQGGWARKVEVIPGANDADTPYGSAESTQFRSVNGWVNGKRPDSDYGCIVLPPNAFGGTNLGSFGFSAMTPQDLVAKPAVLAGYPGDKPFAELWGMSRKIRTITPTTLIYNIDTMGGQSGAPVYIKRDGSRTVVGIHNYGASSGNSATRVTPAVAQRLMAWSKL